MNPFDLSGKVALVTGANTGIGQGIALALARAGADIAAVSRSEPLDTLVAVESCGRRACWIASEFGRDKPDEDLVAQAIQYLGRLDILVNNAGTIRRNDAVDFTEAEWDEVIDVNLKACFFLAQQAARHWLATESAGKIINIASMLSFQGGIRVASYTASKSGVLGLTRILANEWAKHGINVNAIAPGYFETNNTEALRQDETRNRAILERIPAGRWGKPEDLGGAAVFLASAAADYVHGTVLPVDGGWLAR
ncbi:MAG: 2-dehydro-3-deoxy-D-gluconate 5-dehydrogenase KduD [Lysobacterales bacterium]